jgi:hypothetical protein
MIKSLIHSTLLLARKKEHFGDNNAAVATSFTYALASVITFVVVMLILGFVGVFLWNYVIAGKGDSPGLITFAKPATSIWQIIGLYLLITLLSPGSS